MGTILPAAWRYRNKPSLLRGHFQNSKEFWCKFKRRGEIDTMTKEWYPSFPSHFGISWISFWKFVRQKQTRISGVSFCLGDNLVKYCSAIIVFQQEFCFFVLLFPLEMFIICFSNSQTFSQRTAINRVVENFSWRSVLAKTF